MIFDPYASRKLTGKHAMLYRESIGTMLDVFCECRHGRDGESIWSFGVALFDELEWRQQLRLLIGVSDCVLDGKGDPNQWNALEKAAFYAVYHNVYQQLEIERDLGNIDAAALERSFDLEELDDIEIGDDLDNLAHELDEACGDEELSWRELITEAFREMCLADEMMDEEIDESIRCDCEEDESLRHWRKLLDRLADQILDEHEFKTQSTCSDATHETAAGPKPSLEIHPKDDAETIGEPNDLAVASMFQKLADLAGVQPVTGFVIDDDDAPF
jgi:hypothetical protein